MTGMSLFLSTLSRGGGNVVIQEPDKVITLSVDGTDELSEFKPMPPTYTWNLTLNPVDGYYYFAVLSVGGIPLNRSHYVYKYDPEANEIVERVHIPKGDGVFNSYDSHTAPIVHCDESGHIYSVVERGANSTGSGDGHNTDFLVYKTETPGDLSSMALWQTFVGYYCYPKIWQDGSTFQIAGRGKSTAVDVTRWTMLKSVDSGENWEEITVINIPSSSPVRRAYTRSIYDHDNGEMVNVLNVRNDQVGAWESISVMKSPVADGYNWSNFEGTYTKNVNTSGALTLANIEANMLLWKVNPDVETIMFEGGAVRNGICRVLVSRSSMTGVVDEGNAETQYQEMRYYTNSGTGWTYKDVSFAIIPSFVHFYAHEPIVCFSSTNEGDYIYVLDRRTSDCKLIEYRSTDGFDSYRTRTVWEGSGNYYICQATQNINSISQQVIVLNNVIGDYNDFNSYSDLLLINL